MQKTLRINASYAILLITAFMFAEAHGRGDLPNHDMEVYIPLNHTPAERIQRTLLNIEKLNIDQDQKADLVYKFQKIITDPLMTIESALKYINRADKKPTGTYRDACTHFMLAAVLARYAADGEALKYLWENTSQDNIDRIKLLSAIAIGWADHANKSWTNWLVTIIQNWQAYCRLERDMRFGSPQTSGRELEIGLTVSLLVNANPDKAPEILEDSLLCKINDKQMVSNILAVLLGKANFDDAFDLASHQIDIGNVVPDFYIAYVGYADQQGRHDDAVRTLRNRRQSLVNEIQALEDLIPIDSQD